MHQKEYRFVILKMKGIMLSNAYVVCKAETFLKKKIVFTLRKFLTVEYTLVCIL